MGEEKEDPKWADYWSNILIPPHMAARTDVVDHFKRKFYQRYIDPDLVVEPMNTGSFSQPIRQSALSSAPTPPTNDSPRSRSSGSTTRTSSTSTTVEHVAKFLRRNFSRSSLYRKYLEDPCVWVESNTTILSILSSHTEIGLGFLLIISLFSWQRNIIQAFMYWQLLKLMYHAPVTAGYHHSVWAKIGRAVYPFIHRYAPFLNSLLSAVQKWWFR